jgi:hypothetical protein
MGASTRLGQVTPGRGAIAFAWGLSAVVFSAVFFAILISVMFLVAPAAAHPDPSNPLGISWDGWASWVSLGAAWLLGVVMVTAGPGSGLVWKWAELSVVDASGRELGWLRRATRPGLLSAVVLAALAVRHDSGGLLIGVGLVLIALATSLVDRERRGVVEKLLGLRDVTWGLVPVEDKQPAPAPQG